MLNKLVTFLNKKYVLLGASLARIGLGSLIIYFYLIHYAQRYYLWGPNGVVDFNLFLESLTESTSISLYQFSSSHLYFDIIFHLGMIAALLFTIGYKGRLMAIINFVFLWSLHERNHIILDGGNNLMIIILFYLLFANTTAYFAVKSKPKREMRKKERSELLSFTSNALHNFAILAAIVQLCLMYTTSSLYKVMGEVWQNGTAIYYILQVEEFSKPFFRDLISSSEILIVVITYSTILVQMAFPFLLFNKYTKYMTLSILVSMHLGIGVVMGLYTFSFTMICVDLLLIGDSDYKRFYQWAKAKLQRFKRTKQEAVLEVAASQEEVDVATHQLIVFYDSWCPMCTKTRNVITKLDWLNRIKFYSARDEDRLQHYQIDQKRALESMTCIVTRNNRVYDGIYTIIQLALKLPILWVAVPFLYGSVVLGLGQKCYQFIANRRVIVPVGQCIEGESCALQKE